MAIEDLFKKYSGMLPQHIIDNIKEQLPEKVKKTEIKKILENTMCIIFPNICPVLNTPSSSTKYSSLRIRTLSVRFL